MEKNANIANANKILTHFLIMIHLLSSRAGIIPQVSEACHIKNTNNKNLQ
jgi:hypothetical protein